MSAAEQAEQAMEARRHLMDLTRALARHQAEVDRLEQLAAEERARIDAWLADASHGERRKVAELTAEVEGWALAHRTDREKSWSTPWAKITTRPKPGETVVEDEALLVAWCEDNGYARITVKPDVKAIRKDFSVLEGHVVFPTAGGEYRPVPGLRVDGAGETSVTIKPYVPGAAEDET